MGSRLIASDHLLTTSAFLGTNPHLTLTPREESAAPACSGFDSCEIVCRLGLQICPAEKIGEARVRA